MVAGFLFLTAQPQSREERFAKMEFVSHQLQYFRGDAVGMILLLERIGHLLLFNKRNYSIIHGARLLRIQQ